MEIRSTTAGILTALNYIFAFLANKTFLNMVATFTLNGTFWFYSAVAFTAVLVLYFILPETEGRTIEEVQKFFDRNILEHNDATSSQTKTNDTQPHCSYGSV